MKPFLMLTGILLVAGCNTGKTKTPALSSDLIIMSPLSVNTGGMDDTLVIYESVCRGCEYEESTQFVLADSMNLVRVVKTETQDHNDPDTDGGSIDKHIFLVPVKPGKTKLKLFKFNTDSRTADDSLAFTYYELEIKE